MIAKIAQAANPRQATDWGMMEFPKRVLIIDKNPDIRQLIEIHTRKFGNEVAVVSTVREAKSVVELRDFDLIVCDVCSEEAECESFIESIRARQPDFPFILFTENRSLLPPSLRDDHCFSIRRFDFKELQSVLRTLFEDTDEAQNSDEK